MKLSTVYFRAIGLIIPKYASKIQKPDHYFAAVRNKNGIEIGGPSRVFGHGNMLPLYDAAARIDGCNFSNETVWEGKLEEGLNYKYSPGKTGYQYISEASDLRPVEDNAYDFLLSSHCLEHCANPIKTLKEWIRVVRPNGHLIIIVPHKQGTFDHRRPITPLDHVINDYSTGKDETDLTHLDEILRLHDLSMDKPAGSLEAFKTRSMKNFENRCLHHHVFNAFSFASLIDYVRLQILQIDVRLPYHIVVIAKKISGGVSNSEFLQKRLLQETSPLAE